MSSLIRYADDWLIFLAAVCGQTPYHSDRLAERLYPGVKCPASRLCDLMYDSQISKSNPEPERR